MEEEPILEADLVDTPSSVATREFNLVLGTTVALSLVFLFLSAVFGDAFIDLISDEDNDVGVRVPVWERANMPYEVTGDFGVALETGPYDIMPTDNEWNSTHYFVEYELPISEGGAAPNGLISLAVWRPIVEEGFHLIYLSISFLIMFLYIFILHS